MKIAIYGREFSGSTISSVQEVFDVLGRYEVELYIYEKFHNSLLGQINYSNSFHVFSANADIKGLADVMLSLGGDGTMLDTVAIVKDSGIPVIGINYGRLGFLASINKDKISDAISSLIRGDYAIDSRELIEVNTSEDIFGELNFALNDFTIHRRDNAAMMTIKACINDEFLNTYWADGIVVATPTGSTAYSLSCGGPIIEPKSENFVITPVAPHNLNVRPIVIADSNLLSLEIAGRSSSYLISLDSRTYVIDSSLKFTLKKADFHFNLVRLNTESYLATLRNKMLWGIDARNY